MSSGCPAPASARKLELSPLWLPGSTITSPGARRRHPHRCRAAELARRTRTAVPAGPAAGRPRRWRHPPRAARPSADRTSRSGSSSRSGTRNAVRSRRRGRAQRRSGRRDAARRRAQRGGLPPVVERPRDPHAARTNVPTPGLRLDQSLCRPACAAPSAPSPGSRRARPPASGWREAAHPVARGRDPGSEARRRSAQLLSLFMRYKSSATRSRGPCRYLRRAPGLAWGLLGVLAFSFTVPFTRVAVGGLSPLFIGSGRAVVAAVLAGHRASPSPGSGYPAACQWVRLAVVGGRRRGRLPAAHLVCARPPRPASHGAVVIALLPAATAVMAVMRGQERPPRSVLDHRRRSAPSRPSRSLPCRAAGSGRLHWADLLLFGAVARRGRSATPRAGCSPASSARGRPCRGRSSWPRR